MIRNQSLFQNVLKSIFFGIEGKFAIKEGGVACGNEKGLPDWGVPSAMKYISI